MDSELNKEEISNLRKQILFRPEKDLPKHTSNNLACLCSICQTQKRLKFDPINLTHQKEDFANFEGQEFSFTSLLQELGKASNELLLKINIPETVVFLKSRPVFLIAQRADRSLKMTTSGKLLKLHELRKLFPTVVRLRKKFEESGQNKQGVNESQGKEVVLVKFMQRDFDNEMESIHPWNEDGALRVLQESEFIDLFAERSGSQIWKKISYIQGVVKSKTGLNGSFFITYYSHTKNDISAINELEKAGKNENEAFERTLMSDPPKYAEYLTKKIVYTLAVYSQIEILRFIPEFIKDENGKIWFFCANRIAIRRIDYLEPEAYFKKVHLRTAEKKDLLNEEIQYNLFEANEPHQARMKSEMVQFYDRIKDKTGITEVLKEKIPDSRSNEAFRQLRPYTPFVFSQIMNSNFKVGEGMTERVQRRSSVKKVEYKGTVRVRPEGVRAKKVLGARSGLEKWGSIARTTSRFSEKLKGWIRSSKG